MGCDRRRICRAGAPHQGYLPSLRIDRNTREGQEVLSYEWEYDQSDPDDYDAWVNLSVGADYFSCPTCHLILDRYELLEAAGLDEQFHDVGDPADYVEPDYGND